MTCNFILRFGCFDIIKYKDGYLSCLTLTGKTNFGGLICGDYNNGLLIYGNNNVGCLMCGESNTGCCCLEILLTTSPHSQQSFQKNNTFETVKIQPSKNNNVPHAIPVISYVMEPSAPHLSK